MLFFVIFCSSFIFFFNSFSFKPIKAGWRLMLSRSPRFWEALSSFLMPLFHKGRLAIGLCKAPIKMPKNNFNFGYEERENVVQEKISLLDLPDLALESILERLLPAELCNLAGVCSSLRERCTSDHLWEKHLKQKWGGVIGSAACREWQWHMASRNRPINLLDQRNQNGTLGLLSSVRPFSWIQRKFTRSKPRTSLPIMALYQSLESGKFWFPAQVYNRENGHVGFMLSCYDAQLRYDSETNNFRARYSRAMEENVDWGRLRVPPVDTPAHVLHVSDCLNDLRPGDHVEIQWRRSKQFPYGWWYSVIGHLESCAGNENHCRCQDSDLLVLEFKQYCPKSQWRRTIINRKDHQEVGNKADGFYGGIRKLYKEEEVSTWKQHWPKQVSEVGVV